MAILGHLSPRILQFNFSIRFYGMVGLFWENGIFNQLNETSWKSFPKYLMSSGIF